MVTICKRVIDRQSLLQNENYANGSSDSQSLLQNETDVQSHIMQNVTFVLVVILTNLNKKIIERSSPDFCYIELYFFAKWLFT